MYTATAAAVLMLVIAGYARRDDVMRHLPSTARFYSALGLKQAPSAALIRGKEGAVTATTYPVTTAAVGTTILCSSREGSLGCGDLKGERR